MTKLPIFIFSVLLFSLLFFAGCTQENMGIYYSLEVERDLEGDKGLDDSLKVWELAAAGDKYFIAAGKVYRREIADGTWSELAPPAEGMLSSDIEYFNGTVYAMYRTADAKTSKLYTFNTGSGSWTPFDSVSGDTNERVTGIMTVGSGLFVSVLKDDLDAEYNPYSLYYTADGSSFSLVDLPGENDYSVRMIFDGDFDGTNYWFISGNRIFSGTDPSVLSSDVSLVNADGTDISPADMGGIYYCRELEKIFISSKDGLVFVKNGASAVSGTDLSSGWYSSTRKYKGETGEVFYDFIKVPKSDYDQTSGVVVIVGSDNGYYEIYFPGDPVTAEELSISAPDGTTETTTINYLNTKLADNSIRSFSYYAGNAGASDDVIFACTTSSGLWRNTFSSSAGQRVWSRE